MATEWMNLVKKVMKENPTLSFKDVLKRAKREYKKTKGGSQTKKAHKGVRKGTRKNKTRKGTRKH
jgi:hypothetical protein